MDWQKNRLWIGAVALLVLGGAAIWAVSSRTGDTPPSESGVPTDFPEIARDDVRVLEITRPEDDAPIRLERLPPQGHPAGPVGDGDPRRSKRRSPARPVHHAASDLGVRPPHTTNGTTRATGFVDRP